MPKIAFHLETQVPPGTRASDALHAACEWLLQINGDIPATGGNGVTVTRCAPIEREENDTSLPRLIADGSSNAGR
jgi:hypothetical protein